MTMGWLEITVLLSAIWLGQCQVVPSLPKPRIVIVGPTGAGKSSLAEAFLGCDPRGDTCMFEVCNDLNSCTKETSYGYGPWLGTGQLYTVVDTPGFGDSDGDDEELIEEMMGVLVNTIVQADTIVLLLNGKVARFEDHLVKMMRRMAVMFGQEWWDYLVIGVSFWAYDQDSIDDRECDPYYPDDCKDESWFKREINAQIKEKFEIDRNFTFVFTDSWSQTHGHIDDALEQEHWKEETGKLWDITINRVDGFSFKTIDDILEENAAQRAEIKWLNDIITANITELMSRMNTNEADIDALEGTVAELNLAPIGTITAWVNHPTDGESVYLPDGWVQCNGDEIPPPSIWAGKFTPNLNGEKRFLRGGEMHECLELEEDQAQLVNHTHTAGASWDSHSHSYKDSYNSDGEACACNSGVDGVQDHSRTTDSSSHTHTVTIKYTANTSETRPINMKVIYIMRVW